MDRFSATHLFVATPCYGGLVTQAYMESVLSLVVDAASLGLALSLGMLGQDALITRSRNTLVARFLDSGATHLLFIDADIGFETEAVTRLLASGKEIIGGLYPIRASRWDGLSRARLAAGEDIATAALNYVGEPVTPAVEGGLLRSRYAGTGFLLIARSAITRMIASYPETRCLLGHVAGRDAALELHALFDCMIDPDTRTYLSEDYAFCARWRAIGGEVWLDPSVRLTHNGMSEFAGNPASRLGT